MKDFLSICQISQYNTERNILWGIYIILPYISDEHNSW